MSYTTEQDVAAVAAEVVRLARELGDLESEYGGIKPAANGFDWRFTVIAEDGDRKIGHTFSLNYKDIPHLISDEEAERKSLSIQGLDRILAAMNNTELFYPPEVVAYRVAQQARFTQLTTRLAMEWLNGYWHMQRQERE